MKYSYGSCTLHFYVIYLYVKFEVASFYNLEVMPQTKIQSLNLQRTINPKIGGIKLWSLYTALLHNMTYLCMKFEVTSFNTFEVIPGQDFMTHGLTNVRTDRRTYVQTG